MGWVSASHQPPSHSACVKGQNVYNLELVPVMEARVSETITRRLFGQTRAKDLLALVKTRQTALLVVTGVSAYVLTRGLSFDLLEAVCMATGPLLAVSGCTALNMLLDRDIDARMGRTANRPLAAGRIQPTETLVFGGLLSLLGLALSFWLDQRFAAADSGQPDVRVKEA